MPHDPSPTHRPRGPNLRPESGYFPEPQAVGNSAACVVMCSDVISNIWQKVCSSFSGLGAHVAWRIMNDGLVLAAHAKRVSSVVVSSSVFWSKRVI